MNRLIKYLFVPYYGSNRVSRIIRKKLENKPLAELIGIPLISLVFLAAVVVPEVAAGLASTEVYFDTKITTVNAVVAPSRFRWPLPTFGLSQGFHGSHRALDMTNPAGTPVFPIAEGTVILSTMSLNGYGKHVIVAHSDGMVSLYAHLSSILVKNGQRVTKDTEIGGVGATGRATGNHLHFELSQNGVSLNPMEVLPEIKKYESKVISHAPDSSALPHFSL